MPMSRRSREIRRLVLEGGTERGVAEQFGISQARVSAIVHKHEKGTLAELRRKYRNSYRPEEKGQRTPTSEEAPSRNEAPSDREMPSHVHNIIGDSGK
jgi:hypothetical protein